MAKKKIKKFLKKAAKAALIGGALYAGAKGLKGLGKKAKLKGDATLSTDRFFPKNIPHDLESYKPKFVHPPYKASEDKSEYFKKGGRTSKKGGGRTGKQFGGGLNRPVARPIGGVGGVGAPVRPLAYKHGGKVKSMGVAKRGGGIAKR